MRLLVSILLVLSVAGCASNKNLQKPAVATPAVAENPYIKGYLSLDKPTVALQPDLSGPKLFRGNNKDTDNNRMLVKGFDMLGYSSFEAKEVKPEQALEQAKILKADLVLVYTKETSGTPASVKIQQLRDQAMRAKSKTDKDSKDAAPVDDSPVYNYYASYWVKIAPPVIGVHVKGTSKDATVDGLIVLAVIEGSPAFNASLQEGDMLTRIGDIALTNTQSLSQVVKSYEGKTVDVEYVREGRPGKTVMTLNKRK
ncbi:MAG TPA: PDZ domain-containing protein [Methylophilaceae bacterium]|nr:PDZ domain-containing protein [Methylophilaceae bacterium]